MAQFNVDSEALQVKSAAVRGSVERIRAEVETMQRSLQELQGSWTGAASTTFQGLIVEWRGTQVKVESSLESINTALSAAATQYAQTEQANTRMFTAG
ncbi:WXG100 family type VII secretion target [Arthrobacter castelli]|uniref:WXG100 family type VII secretion target n=1 Tax=Arthrobacter castelli TaxID=271431 RepID=UPI0004204A40|nr:WXG100 family type VII secretion target [Arthrobacter castelli]